MERINDGQCNEACRFEYLDDSVKLRALVGVLVDNAVATTWHLRQASLLLFDTPSRLIQCEAELAAVHGHFARLGQMEAKYPDQTLPGFDLIGGTPFFESKLAEWINARTSAPICDVTLRYQASMHGWAGADFHRMCDNVPRLLVCIRSASNFLFGGFTSIGFSGGATAYKPDSTAFLFTLINPHNISPTLLATNNNGQSVYQRSDYGATFGGGHDLHINNNSNTTHGSYSGLSHGYVDTTGKGNALFTGSSQFGTISEILAFSV